jgi:hypothetical protein
MLTVIRIARAAAVAAALTGLMLPVAAAAQLVPSSAYAVPEQTQTQADQDQSQSPGEITGEIASVDGPFNIRVADDQGFLDEVQLRPGTVIIPNGLQLAVGMHITVEGYVDENGVFQADQVDAQYPYAGEPPPPAYYGPGWWYPGFAYGYGPAYCLALDGSGSDDLVQRPFSHTAPWNGNTWNGNGWAGHPYTGVYAHRPPPIAHVGGGYRGPTAGGTSHGYGYAGGSRGGGQAGGRSSGGGGSRGGGGGGGGGGHGH